MLGKSIDPVNMTAMWESSMLGDYTGNPYISLSVLYLLVVPIHLVILLFPLVYQDLLALLRVCLQTHVFATNKQFNSISQRKSKKGTFLMQNFTLNWETKLPARIHEATSFETAKCVPKFLQDPLKNLLHRKVAILYFGWHRWPYKLHTQTIPRKLCALGCASSMRSKQLISSSILLHHHV